MARFWPLKQKKPMVVLGGKKVEVKPMGLEAQLELMLLMGPHLARIEPKIPEIKRAMEASKRDRSDILTVVFRALREELISIPGDVCRAVGLMTGVEAEWLAQNATADELVRALPTLSQVNDFRRIYEAVRGLGVSVGYE